MQVMEDETARAEATPPSLDGLFRREGPGAARVIAAVVSGDVAALRLLLRNGASPDTYFYGRSAVTWAVMQGETAALEVLLEAGANPEAVTAGGRRPLDIATALRCERSIEILSDAIFRTRIRHRER
jgi:ankyrin repeat protein